MNKTQIWNLLKLLKCENITDRDTWVSASCPLAYWTHEHKADKHPSFGISIGERSYFNCFACGKHGNLHIFPFVMAHFAGKENHELREYISRNEDIFVLESGEEQFEVKHLEAIPESVLQSFQPIAQLSWGAVNAKTIELCELRFDPVEYRIIIPIRDKHKRLVGIRGRYVGADIHALRYRTYTELSHGVDSKRAGIWYGQHFPLKENKMLILVEGERDAILTRQEGVANVWASMGASISRKQIEELKEVRNPILPLFDCDKAGQEAQAKVVKTMHEYVPLYRTANHYGCKDPAEMVEKKVFKQVLKSLELLSN